MRFLRIIFKSPLIICVLIIIFILFLLEIGIFGAGFSLSKFLNKRDKKETGSIDIRASNYKDNLAKANKIDKSIKRMNTTLKELLK